MAICKLCNETFDISAEDRAFYIRIKVPEPKNCPLCREQARLIFRNERHYYARSCDLCKKSIISVYDPKRTKNVYCLKCFWSDNWDARNYGKDFDSNKSFFDVYKELLDEVPKLAMMNDNDIGSENCEYTYDLSRSKNCYLVIGSWFAHDCMYGFQINHVKDCYDNFFVNESEMMYDSVACEKCYNCQHCVQCNSSFDCIFGYDLKNCKDCICCAGLRNKQYYIWNEQYSKDEYQKIKADMHLSSWLTREQTRTKFQQFLMEIPRKFAVMNQCEDCSGNNLFNCKNSHECFNHRNLHNCKWMTNGDGARDCYECWSTGGPELCYSCITPDNSYAVNFSIYVWKSHNVDYSDNCHSSNNLFGCVGMKRAQYCILNKQYSKEEYCVFRKKIIEQMQLDGSFGEFFPANVSPFAYNETAAQEWHPLNEAEARHRRYNWCNVLPGTYDKATVSWSQIKDGIDDVKICSEIFSCLSCKKNYRILEKEFEFYKRQKIPLPRFCADCRYYRRKNFLGRNKLWKRQCMCDLSGHVHHLQCSENFLTTYSPDMKEIVYCEACYNRTVN